MKPAAETLKPDDVGRLWGKLKSYALVAQELADRGIVNPTTRKPYSRATVARLIRRSRTFRYWQKKSEAITEANKAKASKVAKPRRRKGGKRA